MHTIHPDTNYPSCVGVKTQAMLTTVYAKDALCSAKAQQSNVRNNFPKLHWNYWGRDAYPDAVRGL